MKYDCHINVECVASFKTVKYVFKYINKGPDCGTLAVEDADEIKQYIEGRYFSASEAIWRIFHFDLFKQIPNVVCLPVHLPGQHLVSFDPDENASIIRQRIAQEKSVLTAFFKANSDPVLGQTARLYLYQEFPQHFVFIETKKQWKLRQSGFALGRMSYVAPTAGERFYLRTLLTVVKGPTSWKDLLTHHNVTYNTFQECCIAHGLLEDDGEWKLALREASEMQTGHSLCQLFSTLLMFCYPQDPGRLWNDFREHICDDLQHRLRVMGHLNPSESDAYDFGLHLLDEILKKSGYSLNDFHGMPLPQLDWAVQSQNPLIIEQMNYDKDFEQERAQHNLTLMDDNPEQRNVFDKVIESVEKRSGGVFFLEGSGGTGKTFTYKTIAHAVQARGWIVLCVASTGIAGNLLTGGRTAHSMFKIPINLHEQSICNIPKQSQRAELLQHTHLIIWDESVMQHRFAVEALDRTCHDICDDDVHPFGGITVVFGGDFQQTLPIVVKGTQEDIVSACLKRSYLWQNITHLTLTKNLRLEQNGSEEEKNFAAWLLDIGHGHGLTPDSNTIKLRDGMQMDSEEALIDIIYHDLSTLPTAPPPKYFLERAILAPRNADVNILNATLLNRLPGEELHSFSADSVVIEQGSDGDNNDPIPPEVLQDLDIPGFPPGELHLKVGCPLILLCNLAPGSGLCNGTRLILLRCSDRVLEAKIMGGDFDGQIVFIPRITLTPSSTQHGIPFHLKRRQFPVRLAFVLTIN